MSSDRATICHQTAAQLMGAKLGSVRATIGLDGFVDEIIAVVDKRVSFSKYEPVKTISAMAKKIHDAIGQSSNYELIVKQRKLGGNGPIMSNALAAMGLDVTYIGNLGFPLIDPVFEDFSKRAKVISIADAGHTDALEFEDGKLMLGKIQSLDEVTWENLTERVGADRFQQLMDESSLIGMVNWTMLPHMSSIWSKLLDEVIPKLAKQKRKFFVDLADPEKRTHDDIHDALKILTQFSKYIDVILGLNLKESTEIAEVLHLPAPSDPESAIEHTAAAIREELKLSCVVIHPRRGAAAATKDGSASFAGPFVQQPKISTGAGDHFNAGFCLGQVLGFTLEQSLCVGVATSGYYVRSAESPTAAQLAEFITKLPPPQ